MLSEYREKQKSLKRRFLLVLGVITFLGLLVLGGLFLFWDKMPFEMPVLQKRLFGGFIIVYDIVRFQRIFRKDPDED